MRILLFDMDGVLLEAHGYHRALQETVRLMALALGFDDGSLSPDDIAAFEAAGITSEWDTAAICTARLMLTAWDDEPGRGLPDTLAGAVPPPRRKRHIPDFNALAQSLAIPSLMLLPPLERAESLLLKMDRHTPAQERLLRDLLRNARTPEGSLTHRTFQEFVLGSDEFARAYGLPAVLHSESYLLKYDRSNLSPAESARLRDWLSAPDRAAVVMTSRPSRPPAGIFSTPEAELGAALTNLDGLPIAGWGGMCWLGLQRRVDPQTFLKPSPVHALAALRLALGDSLEAALSEAADLAEGGRAAPAWVRLDGAQASVFEDAPGGIISLRAAHSLLDSAGIHLETKYLGIAQNPVKVQALKDNGAQLFSSLPAALATIF